jgi:hypothetical protein
MKKLMQMSFLRRSLSIVVAIMLLAAFLPVQTASASTVPSFFIVSVVKDSSVTIQTSNFPAGQIFTVRMGTYGTLAIGGVEVATTNSGAGGAFQATYTIPASLKGLDRIAIRFDSPDGYFTYGWFWNNISGYTGGIPGYIGVPTFSIVSVAKDDKVTIRTNNFPGGLDWKVRMGAYGTQAIGGVEVATTNSGSGGSFEATYSIPDILKGAYQIAIRMEATNGYYAYNWFYNNTTGTSGTGGIPGYSGIPTFGIKSVVKDSTVTILTANFPPNMDFTVRMGAYGTQGIGGIVVATTNSGSGGVFEATYNVPDALKGSSQIAIRMEGANGYFAYNWFWNNTAGGTSGSSGSGGVPSSYSGIPTFTISAVSKDNNVTIVTNNLPPNQDFTVRMGAYGTAALGGIVVTTFNTGSGGSQTLSYNIPDVLKGSTKIAIRMDSNLGYFAYNWFWNNSTN